MTDFSRPQRMGAAAFVILFIKYLKPLLGTFLIYCIIDIPGSYDKIFSVDFGMRVLVGLAVFAGFAVLFVCAAYFPRKFYVRDGALVFTQGILERQTTTIPLDKVHSLRTKRGLWYRILGLRGIIFDTLATKVEEVELIMSEADWQSLAGLLKVEERPKQESGTPPPFMPTHTRRFSEKHLLLDVICQNHLKGMAILGSFLVSIMSHFDDFDENQLESMTEYATSRLDDFTMTPLLVVALFAAVYVVILVLWLAKTLLRYSDMSLSWNKEALLFSYGLIARVTSRFSQSKICTIRLKRNFLEKEFGLATLMLQQAINASAKNEEDKLKLYGADQSDFYLRWWLGENYSEADELVAAKSGRGVFFRVSAIWLIVAVIAGIIIFNSGYYAWLALPAAGVPLSLFAGYRDMCRSRIYLKASHIEIHGGIFTDVTNYIKYDNIEVVRVSATPLTCFFHRVSLTLSTSGTTFKVRSIPESTAYKIADIILH